MIRTFRTPSASRATLASLAALYAIAVIFTVLLSDRLLNDPEVLDLRLNGAALLVGILFPLGLLVAVGLSVAQLIRDRRERRPGSTFKSRLLLFFALVVILAAVPQGIVSVTVLSNSLQLLFRAGTGDAIRGGLQIALDYYEREIHQLETLARDGTLARLNAGYHDAIGTRSDGGTASDAAAERYWEAVQERIPLAVALQLFDESGASLLFNGDDAFRRDRGLAIGTGGTRPPTVTRQTVNGLSVLRLDASIDGATNGELRAVTIVSRLPDGFSESARELTRAVSLFSRLEELRPLFVVVVAAVYAVFAAPIMLLAVLASFFLSDRIMRPIELLEDATRRVAEGDYSVRILTRANDDLGLLVVSFNRMVTELDRARRRMAQAEKVQAWQEIAQRLAHEVKNPLTPIRLAAERLRRRYNAGEERFAEVLDRTVDTIVREVDALTALLNEFRSFSRLPQPSVESTGVRALVAEIAEVYRESPAVSIDYGEVEPDLTFEVDRGQMRQVLLNLFTNAIDAAGGQVRIVCRAASIVRSGERYCRLRIQDDGPGIPADLGRRVFEPYVTSKPHGTGLGLAIVERIVFDHDGSISFESAPGRGTTFVMDIPLVHQPARQSDQHPGMMERTAE